MRILFTLLALQASLGAEVPSWLREMATMQHPTYPAQTKAVVLFKEEKVVVDESGKQTTTTREVIKILTLEGKSFAQGGVTFDSRDSKVREFRAWVLQPSGKSRDLGKKEFAEGSVSRDELYNSIRYMSASAASEIDPNGIFGFESVVEEKTVFSQFGFAYQDLQPHLLSRFQLTVPAGWSAEAKGYEGGPSKPEINGNTYTWEARKLGFIEREPGAPKLGSLVPRIRVSMLPPAGQTSSALVTFANWKDVSEWQTKIAEVAGEVTPAIEAKAKALTDGKSSELDRIRAIGEFAQGIRYVLILTNISKGGGYVPHAAEQVMRNSYGDCKDKANLMRTLLKSIGVKSWMVAIHSGDPRYAREDWPSPRQFNHAIIAVSVPENTQSPAALTHPTLGRLLLFDPTDDVVPFGFLPDHEQGAYALVIAGEKGSLIKTAQTAPKENHTDRKWEITLNPDGSLTGKLEEVSTGQEAFDAAEAEKNLSKDQVRKGIEFRMSTAIPGSEIESLEQKYDSQAKTYRLSLGFKAASYARIMKGKLWMVRSAPMTYYGVPNLNKATREQTLVLQPVSFTESIEWHVPSNLKVDEVPDSDHIETGFGKFRAEWKTAAGSVKVTRAVELQSQVLAPSEYKSAREFVMRFNGSESAPFVLMAQ